MSLTASECNVIDTIQTHIHYHEISFDEHGRSVGWILTFIPPESF